MSNGLAEGLRVMFMFGHVMTMVYAGIAMTACHHAIFRYEQMRSGLLLRSAQATMMAILAHWISGLLVLAFDTGFSWQLIARQPLLLSKITVMGILTLKTVVFYKFALPRLVGIKRDVRGSQGPIAMLGVMSVSSWVYLVFLGVAKPLLGLGYGGFMALYGGVMLLAAGFAWRVVGPRIRWAHQHAKTIIGYTM